MAGITIFRQIIIKELVTEESKSKKIKQLNQDIIQIETMIKEHREKTNKTLTEISLNGADQNQIERFRQQLDSDVTKYHTERDSLLIQIDDVKEIVIGDEIAIGSVEGPYELQVGQMLTDATSAEIVIKDGVIVEIRNN